MGTTRKSLQRVTTSKLEPYQRSREGEGEDGWQIEGEAKRLGNLGRQRRENGQKTTTSNPARHIRKMDEGGGRQRFIPSTVLYICLPFCVSLSAFHSFSVSQIFILCRLSCFVCPSVCSHFFILLLSTFLHFFKPVYSFPCPLSPF